MTEDFEVHPLVPVKGKIVKPSHRHSRSFRLPSINGSSNIRTYSASKKPIGLLSEKDSKPISSCKPPTNPVNHRQAPPPKKERVRTPQNASEIMEFQVSLDEKHWNLNASPLRNISIIEPFSNLVISPFSKKFKNFNKTVKIVPNPLLKDHKKGSFNPKENDTNKGVMFPLNFGVEKGHFSNSNEEEFRATSSFGGASMTEAESGLERGRTAETIFVPQRSISNKLVAPNTASTEASGNDVNWGRSMLDAQCHPEMFTFQKQPAKKSSSIKPKETAQKEGRTPMNYSQSFNPKKPGLWKKESKQDSLSFGKNLPKIFKPSFHAKSII